MKLHYVLLAFAIIALNAFFVATEFAIVRVRNTRIEELVTQGVRRATAVREVLRNLNAYLSACQLGVTMASLGLGWVGEMTFAGLLEPLFEGLGRAKTAATHSLALTLAFLCITFLHVVLGELAPKNFAIDRAESVALMVSRPIRVFHGVFFPVIWMLNRVANLVVRTLGVRGGGRHEVAHSEEELRMILAISHRDGIIPAPTVKLLERALDFADRTVRQVMVPRADLVFLDVNKPFAENLDAARRGGHTRYPLCDGDLDRVIGVVNIKDLFLTPPGEGETVDLRAFAYDPILIPESLALEKALALFQKQRLHLGIVIDEYGGTSGIVTLEDVLEELIGEIQDEFDEEPPKLVALPDGRTSVAATFPLSEIEEKLGIEEQAEEGVDTLGGLVLARLGRLARVGDRVEIGGRMIEVTRVRGRRILRLVTYPPARSGGA